MRFRKMMLALVGLALTAGCGKAADTTIRYKDPDGDRTLTIEASGDNLRAEEDSGQMVIRRGKDTYVIIPLDGKPSVVLFDDFIAVGGEARKQMQASGALSAGPDTTKYTLKSTGPRKIGAWQGVGWSLDPEGSGISMDTVFSSDPKLKAAGAIAVSAFETFEQLGRAVLIYPDEYVRLYKELFAKGMPLKADGLVLQSISADPVPAARFELPAPAMAREAFRKSRGL